MQNGSQMEVDVFTFLDCLPFSKSAFEVRDAILNLFL